MLGPAVVTTLFVAHAAALLLVGKLDWAPEELLGMRLGLAYAQLTLLSVWIYVAPSPHALLACFVLGAVGASTERGPHAVGPIHGGAAVVIVAGMLTVIPLMAAKVHGSNLSLRSIRDVLDAEMPRRVQFSVAGLFGAMLAAAAMFVLARVGARAPAVVWVGTLLGGWLWVISTLFVILSRELTRNTWWYLLTLATGGFAMGTALGKSLPTPAWLGIGVYTAAVLGSVVLVRACGYHIAWTPEPPFRRRSPHKQSVAPANEQGTTL